MPPLAHYKLNGDANDAGGNGYDGTPTDITYPNSKPGLRQAANFNGSTSKSAVTMNITAATFTISLWFKDGVIDTGAKDHLCSKWLATGSKRSWFLCLNYSATSNGDIMFGVSDLGTNYMVKTTGNGKYTAATWHHLVAVYNAGTYSIWLDGEPIGLSTYTSAGAAPTGAPYNCDAEVRLGSAQFDSGAERFFDGLLDDVRIYDEALPTWKIKAIYNFGRGNEECEPWQRLIRSIARKLVQPLIGA